MIKIVFLANAYSIHVVQWALYMKNAGLEVIVISQDEPNQDFPKDVPVYITPFRGEMGYFLNIFYVKKLLKKLKPDLVHAHYASGYGTLARLVNFHPYVLSVWGSDVYDFPYKSQLHCWIVRKNLYAADKLSSTSHCMMEQTLKIAPNLESFDVIPFGVDLQKFVRTKDTDKEKNTIVVGTVKTLSEKYGIDLLIKAFFHLKERISVISPETATKLRLRIVGGGYQEKELKSLVKQLGIEKVTCFVGAVSHNQVPYELSKLDIYVALSRWDSESFGVAIIEAGIIGLPVVVANVGGLPEVVQDNHTGFVVPKENPEKAAEALEKLVLNPELRHHIGLNAQKFIKQNFSWNFCVKKMSDLYQKLISYNNHEVK